MPNYDQGWQVTYKYREPKLLPKGTRIEASFWYDSTEERGVRQGFNADRSVGSASGPTTRWHLAFLSYTELDDASTTNDQD